MCAFYGAGGEQMLLFSRSVDKPPQSKAKENFNVKKNKKKIRIHKSLVPFDEAASARSGVLRPFRAHAEGRRANACLFGSVAMQKKKKVFIDQND